MISEQAIEQWLRQKYVTHSDPHQRAMGITYITAGVDDLAKELCQYITHEHIALIKENEALWAQLDAAHTAINDLNRRLTKEKTK